MKNVDQLASEILAAARAAAPGFNVTAASILASAETRPCVFIHAYSNDGYRICGHGDDFAEAALALFRNAHAPRPDAEKIVEESP